jgi:hypothetical protein
MAAKAAYLAKSGREKRNLERQKARNLTKEELDRQQELENKKLVSDARSVCCMNRRVVGSRLLCSRTLADKVPRGRLLFVHYA